jgi:exodeoxyribonuclease-3
MRVITLNVNGIRSATAKGLPAWLAAQDADLVCLQETRAQAEQLRDPVYHPAGYHCHYLEARKKGYSGVALYSRRQPDRVLCALGWEEADSEGRYLEACFGDLAVASVYLPSGSAGAERQAAKLRFMARFMPHLRALRASGRRYILCGDWNIAHRPIDLKNWRANQTRSGFLPEERAWLDEVFGPVGFVDAFRVLNQEPGQYTWWSNRGQAWARNVGWRIDYQVISPDLRDRVRGATIYKASRFSDHAPLTMDYDLSL